MIVPLTLALPCRVLKLDVLVGPPEGVTPLEDLVARGVLAAAQGAWAGPPLGAGDVQDRAEATMSYLTTLLCIPQRIVMEVVGTLWSKGHLTVDFDSGGIQLSEAARAKITSQQSLADGGELQTREFLFEPVTGMIRSTFHARGRASETSIRLPLRPQLKVSDIPPAELVSSVQSALRTERQRRGRVNVLSVGFGTPALQSAERIVWLEVDAVVRRDPDNGRVQFTTSETSGWSLRSQRRLNTFFDRLMAEEPNHPVVQAVSGQAQIEREAPDDLDDLFRRMRRRLDRLEAIDLDQVQERHKWLSEWAAQIDDRLEDIRRAQARVSLITRPEGHTWTVNDLIASARRQLVLVVPDPDPGKVRQFLPGLRRALDHGVQVVFVWGRSSNEQLNSQVENLLDELYLRPGARLLRNPKSAKTEACLVIQDDCRAMVGSHSCLGYKAPEPAEVSVLIEPAESGPEVPAAVAELLQWTRREFDPWVMAQKIEQADMGATRATAGSSIVNPSRPDGVTDSMSDDVDAADVDASSLALWAAGWNDVYAGLAETRRQLLAKAAAVQVVRDAEHRTLLWQGIRDAQIRLVISDDRLSTRSAGPAVARHLRERRAAGAAVHVLHPDPHSSEPGLQEFAKLARGANSISVRHQRTGGRLLIADDWVVIGSFSPFDDRRGEGIGRRVSRLGVQIRHDPFAAELADLLGARSAGTPSPEAAEPVPEPPSSPSGAGAGIALLLEARSVPAQDFGRVAAERLRAHDRPFDVLKSWLESDVPRGDLRRVAAAALHNGLGPARQAETWLGWLVEDGWTRGAFVEAALLSRWEPEARDGEVATPDRPLRAAALLAAALETRPLTGDMAEAVFDLGDSLGAKTAGAASLACDVLVCGSTGHRDFLGLLSGDLAPAWRDFCSRVESFGSAPLPLSRFAADQNRSAMERAIEERRAKIIGSIDRIEALRNRFSFNTGVALHRELFRTGGLLQQLRAAARAGAPECQELALQVPHNVRRHLDDVIAGAGAEPMEWLKQISFLRRIEGLVRDLRAVAAAAGATQVEPRAEDRGLAETVELGKYLSESWARLYTEAQESGRPYALPAMALLTLLNPLTTWAKEQT
ncbi:hypothetical protein [Jiangella sp. DSM 45060]|uniref:hypothetical protein n=1 Tax=Jiangella sp. DSM 45060 TaxID=1798224 RepID=UPI000879E9F9|nr:hypothetical protein [Jiangella sp. DSM 45060]SDT20734.1 hypothetical protein SAMN04515669_3103 [Jiangella sp. DSM 45060]